MTGAPGTPLDRVRLAFGRVVFRAIVIGLLSGISLHLMDQTAWAALVLSWTCGLLILVPATNLVFVCVEEIRRRDWVFTAIALAVVGLLAYALAAGVLRARS